VIFSNSFSFVYQAVINQDKQFLTELFLETFTYALKNSNEDEFISIKNLLIELLENPQDTENNYQQLLSFFSKPIADLLQLLESTKIKNLDLLMFYPALLTFEFNNHSGSSDSIMSLWVSMKKSMKKLSKDPATLPNRFEYLLTGLLE
jgi:hypothetical protein